MPASQRGERLHPGGVEFKLFTPLLAEYIKTNLPVKLPAKEAKLFKLLRKNIGKVTSKDEIFTEVWGEENIDATGKSDLPTDWALDALIYRLRKHPFITSHGYIIESHKKVGYTLIQT
jgi:DNA-binding response OmpR family regulator